MFFGASLDEKAFSKSKYKSRCSALTPTQTLDAIRHADRYRYFDFVVFPAEPMTPQAMRSPASPAGSVR